MIAISPPICDVFCCFTIVILRWKFDETWGYTHGRVIGETGVVCDWSAVRDGTLDMPNCNKGICGGHYEHDMLPFEIKVLASESLVG